MERHFTATAYIVEDERVLLLIHPKLRKWLPPGGHIEPNESPPEAARREAREETGLEIAFITQENLWVEEWNARSFERPFLCLTEEIPPHGDQPAHQHLDMIYLAYPTGGELQKTDELRWFTLDEVAQLESNVEIFAETQQVIRTIFATADEFLGAADERR